jgi:8-oxo-dGTP diphosphatase
MLTLPYTICFCLCSDQVLMLYRSNPPNAGRWNGLGGKLETGETPWSNIHREVLEEATLDLHQAEVVRFAGLVTWTVPTDLSGARLGMYAFLARLAPDGPLWPDRLTLEGVLSWKALDWVCDRNNPLVVNNIPHFLPVMLSETKPQEYCCSAQDGRVQMVIRELPAQVNWCVWRGCSRHRR